MIEFINDFFAYRFTSGIFSSIFNRLIFNDGTKVIASLFVISFVFYIIKRVFWG